MSFFINLIEILNATSVKTETKQVRITDKLLKKNNSKGALHYWHNKTKHKIIKSRTVQKNRKIG